MAAYCAAYGSMIEAEAARRQGADDATDRRLRQSAEQMLRYAIEFGMSPASRSRVHVAGVPEPKLLDDEAFLAGRGLRLV